MAKVQVLVKEELESIGVEDSKKILALLIEINEGHKIDKSRDVDFDIRDLKDSSILKPENQEIFDKLMEMDFIAELSKNVYTVTPEGHEFIEITASPKEQTFLKAVNEINYLLEKNLFLN